MPHGRRLVVQGDLAAANGEGHHFLGPFGDSKRVGPSGAARGGRLEGGPSRRNVPDAAAAEKEFNDRLGEEMTLGNCAQPRTDDPHTLDVAKMKNTATLHDERATSGTIAEKDDTREIIPTLPAIGGVSCTAGTARREDKDSHKSDSDKYGKHQRSDDEGVRDAGIVDYSTDAPARGN